MTKALLAFDTDRIKSYVFATDKLKEIRGASAILDELNREQMVKEVKKYGGEKIYANGGSGLFLIGSAQAEKARVAVEKLYNDETRTASITGAWVDLPLEYKNGDNIQNEFKILSYRLRAAKDSKARQMAMVTHPYLHFCESCGVEYAGQENSEEDNPILLCASCSTKREKDKVVKEEIHRIVKRAINKEDIKEAHLWHHLIPELHSHEYAIDGYDRPDDFEALAKMSTPSNYIGLIYADGDAMGKELEELKSETDFKKFSESIDGSIYKAVAKAISEHLQPNSNKNVWPFDILLLGGDDLVMVTPADKVLEVGLTIMQQFTQLTGGKNLSVGIAIAHANYPFGQLRRLAESALKFAKKEGAKRRQSGQHWQGGLLNFVVVSSANHLEFGEYYKQVLKQQDDAHNILYRTQRPYTIEAMRYLLDQIKTVRDVPNGKLEQLRSAIFKSKKQSTIEAMMITLRSRETVQKKLLELVGQEPAQQLDFPWIAGEKDTWITPILDIVELIDFVKPKEG
jgi:hypothetical protein